MSVESLGGRQARLARCRSPAWGPGCRSGRPASSGRVSSEVGFSRSCVRLVGGHTPLQIALCATCRPARAAAGRAVDWYCCLMVRTLDLAAWAGRWVALDQHDQVQRDAATLAELMEIMEADGVEGLEIMRAPVPGEPVVFGLG